METKGRDETKEESKMHADTKVRTKEEEVGESDSREGEHEDYSKREKPSRCVSKKWMSENACGTWVMP